MLWILVAALAFVTVAILIVPLLRASRGPGATGLLPHLSTLGHHQAAGVLSSGHFGFARRLLSFDERSFRPARGTGWLLSALIPVLILAIYLPFGLPGLPSSSSAAREERLEAVVSTLQDHLGRNPEDVEGWLVMGQALGHLGRTDEALDAYARAQSLAPEDAVWLEDLRDRVARLAAEH